MPYFTKNKTFCYSLFQSTSSHKSSARRIVRNTKNGTHRQYSCSSVEIIHFQRFFFRCLPSQNRAMPDVCKLRFLFCLEAKNSSYFLLVSLNL